MSKRPDWNEYFMGIAEAVAKRADCTRRQVGCVIVGPDHRIVSTGYNGGPSGGLSCLAGQCPRGQHFLAEGAVGLRGSRCACGNFWPCSEAVGAGSSYDTGAGSCISIHAEANALIYADRHRLTGAVAYVTCEPCDGCRRLLSAADLAKVIYNEPIDGAMFTNLLDEGQVKLPTRIGDAR